MFGTSNSFPDYYVSPQESYWGLTAQYLNVDTVVNYSYPAMSYDALEHILVSKNLQIDWDNSFILFSLPPLERALLFDNHQNTETPFYTYDKQWNQTTGTIEPLRGLMNIQGKDLDMHKTAGLYIDRSWVETFMLRRLYLLTQWLDKLGASYFINNHGGKDLDVHNHWNPSSFVLPYFLKFQRCDLFENGYHTVNEKDNIKPADFNEGGWMGHHGAEGNRNYFEKTLRPKLEQA